METLEQDRLWNILRAIEERLDEDIYEVSIGHRRRDDTPFTDMLFVDIFDCRTGHYVIRVFFEHKVENSAFTIKKTAENCEKIIEEYEKALEKRQNDQPS